MKTRYAMMMLVVSGLTFAAIAMAAEGDKATTQPVMTATTQPAIAVTTQPAATQPAEWKEAAGKYPMSVTEALAKRRSIRSFSSQPLTDDEVSLLCWAGQGITDFRGRRTAPSAMAIYPMTLYVVTDKGLSEYLPKENQLKEIKSGEIRKEFNTVARQGAMKSAPAVFVIAADWTKAKARMGDNAERFCYMEVGHIAQNILLQATAMGLGGVPAAGFDPAKLTEVLALPQGQEVVYIVPVGHKK
jgi:SagB-type dehydrogenase family enzyme